MTGPTISVIVLNYNGRQHLETCFSSLMAQSYPEEQSEFVLVDNASADGSVEFVRETFPRVRIIQNDTNLGFAAANNRGAQAAHGEYLVFLNNDTRVAEDCLVELVKPCLVDPEVACTGAKILDWEGQYVDFVAAVVSYYGFAFQLHYRSRDVFDTPGPLLFACGGAMLIRRSVFLTAGGFDEDYFIYFEDVDLGWRLWLMGYQVSFAPKAVVYHRLHATMDKFSNFRKWLLFERNALVTVLKNYDDANLNRVLPAALMLMFKRAESLMRADGWSPQSFFIGDQSDVGYQQSIPRSAIAVLAAANEVIDSLPHVYAKRARVQALRRRSDREIFALFRQPLRPHPLLYPVASVQHDMQRLLGIADLFEAVPRRVLVVAGAGSGRAEELAGGLQAYGHEVRVLCAPAAEAAPTADMAASTVPASEPVWAPGQLVRAIDENEPDIALLCDWHALAGLSGLHIPVVLDMGADEPWPAPVEKSKDGMRCQSLAQADLITCATEAQAAALRPWLEHVGPGSGDECLLIVPSPDPMAPAASAGRPAAACDALDHFCRHAYKRSASAVAPEPRPAGTPPPLPPSKGLHQLLGEAAFHYRRGGVRTLAVETLGYLQRKIANG